MKKRASFGVMTCVPAILMASGPVQVSAAETAAEEGAPEEMLETVTVTGIRGSLESAAEQKRNAKQIVDLVVATDIGKLPDNNVPEAISRVTGVQLDRIHGEGTNVTIRGMSDIQTTVNGYSSSVGEGRATNLADIPAELLKSVEVYKTRTADQVEGGIAGTVNVNLRRPLDLKPGWTAAGSARGVYSDIGKDWSPYSSLLVANRFDTAAGEMGFLVNTSYTQNRYEENFIDSESPGTFFDRAQASLPADQQDIIAPYANNYGVERGKITRPSINLVTQWRATDALDFVLEGSYFSSEEERARDRLHLVVRDGQYSVSNVVLAPDGRTVKSLTLTNPNGVNGGPESYYEEVDSHNYATNLEAHWVGSRARLDASAQYSWSDTRYYNILNIVRFRNQTTANVDFNSPNAPDGGPYIEFPGTDMTDVSRYGLFQMHDEQALAESNEFASQADLTFDISDTSFFRSVQGGLRYSARNTERHYGYRDANPTIAGLPPALTDFPGGANYSAITPNIRGAASPTWYRLSGTALLSDYDNVRNYLSAWSADWDTARPKDNRGGSFESDEDTLAGYAQLNYAFTAGIPVTGVAGARVVRTWGENRSAEYRPDPNGGPDQIQDVAGEGDYTDVLPSINAILHFTPKTQLRLAYTYNVQRPTFFDMRPFAFYETRANPPLVFAGNPDLQPNKETSYDLSLEHSFGRSGSLSLAAFLKKPDGFLYYSGQNEFIPRLGVEGTVFKLRNAGPGEFQGYEAAIQSFFDFLPGFWRNFGGSANYTYLPKFEIDFPFDEAQASIPGIFDAPGTSKYTYNLALYYDTPQFSARVAYNERAKRKDSVWIDFPEYSPYTLATSRLDAAIDFTPFKYATFMLEATNLLRSNTRRYFGSSGYLPLGPRYEARTIQIGARYRF